MCFVLLQVAAVYRDPSVGNLINIMIVKLVIVHNEQVSAESCTLASASSPTWLTSVQVSLAWTLLCGACLRGHYPPCQTQVSRWI